MKPIKSKKTKVKISQEIKDALTINEESNNFAVFNGYKQFKY